MSVNMVLDRPRSANVEDAQALNAYMRNLELRGLARTTRNNRRSQLELLVADLDGVPLFDATHDDLLAWVDQLARLNLTARTRYAKISLAHCFYTWALDEGFISEIPTRRLPRPRLPRLLPRPIPEDSLERALTGAPQDLRAWLTLMAYAGLRCCEIAPMTRDQILDTMTPPVLLVHGKGNKDRIVPLNQHVLTELRACGLPARGYLWTSRTRTGRPPTANRISQVVNTWLHESGIPDTAHSLRHRFATQVAAAGDIQTTAELLGHADLSNVQIYALFNNARAVTAVMALDDLYPAEPPVLAAGPPRSEVGCAS